MNAKRFYPTAIALYFTYFIHGIGVSILGQYKQDFAGVWGADKLSDGTFDVSMVIAVIAALGLGRLLTLPISGPFSDKFGRKPSALIGVALYAVYFIGLAFAPNMYIAYAFAFVGGAANSFLDTAVTPSVLEIFTKNGAIANMFTKFSISIGQFVLPFAIGMVAAANMSFRTLFVITMVLIVIDGLIIAFMPFPPMNNNVGGEKAKPEKMKFNATSWAIIGIGFTCTSTFQLWLNCNQELGKLYGMADPSKIQSFYSLGTMCAILITAVLVKKFILPVRILILYPAIATLMLLIIYIVQTPTICLIGGFVIGYAAAGGVLQLAVSTANEFFPTNKGKITSIVMISSSLANYIVLNVASYITKAGGIEGPKYVLLFNVAITVIGILLAIFVNMRYKNESKIATK
ncbi:MFS transporter [Listeria monocytogenes]|uniref:Inner membrane transport protein YdiM n=3 Tax=Listeria monocytogenes TaxID=1639 RepID=A0A0B8R9M2_LISMN|nr:MULTISPECIES: MFS transporter [Listeria]EAE1680561.1 MFS transporter [Listeria monocytogenes LIS0071]EAE3706571.1 MFS transporter [Listeria monocytogenes serotype 1/2b]EAF3077684.1 MFS transporter [Listeria monocytogenes serotype 1/2a]EAG6332432.1 MFS transporter [Listeria monocytogenes CFSAN002346]EAG6349885.1 MFS transporter [Listeria monocytogenes LIS0102]EAG6365089.1 MFS transporter [Listeria monocytogenes LIS0063]EAG6374327.1 MFS transporter [Listeria monocytogenes CFSAN002356]EAG63